MVGHIWVKTQFASLILTVQPIKAWQDIWNALKMVKQPFETLTLNSLLSLILICALVMSPSLGLPIIAIFSLSVRSSGDFFSASAAKLATSSKICKMFG